MGKRRAIGLAVLLAAVFGGWMWLLLRPAAPGPVYEGQPLSYWLERYQPLAVTNLSQRAKAEAAMQQAGTNALPTLLRMLHARDSDLTLKLLALAQKQHVVAVHHVPATDLNFQAQAAFRTLGAGASNAVPELINILEEKRSMQSELFTIYSLAHIGPPAAAAVPALLQCATNPTPAMRYNAFWALGCIKADPEKSVPALVRGLTDPDRNGRIAAVDALGEFGAAARPAVPALITAAGDTQVKLRDNVIEALKKIDPAAVEMLPKEK